MAGHQELGSLLPASAFRAEPSAFTAVSSALPLEVPNLLHSKRIGFGATVYMFMCITSVYSWTCKVYSNCFPINVACELL